MEWKINDVAWVIEFNAHIAEVCCVQLQEFNPSSEKWFFYEVYFTGRPASQLYRTQLEALKRAVKLMKRFRAQMATAIATMEEKIDDIVEGVC